MIILWTDTPVNKPIRAVQVQTHACRVNKYGSDSQRGQPILCGSLPLRLCYTSILDSTVAISHMTTA